MESPLGIEGYSLQDPLDARRIWQIQSIYLPAPGRMIGGIRAKMRDQKGFITFCNQRDLEVLMGYGVAGDFCPWLDGPYVDMDDPEWFGLCCDDDDLLDDLYEREWFLRGQLPDYNLGVITPDYSLQRRVHLSHHNDVEDSFVMLGDIEPETLASPDTRFETLERRWMRAERRKVRWEKS